MKLAVHECANYDNGYCLEQDTNCKAILPQYTVHDGAIGCDYFLEAVLPADEELHRLMMTLVYRDEYAPWITVHEAADSQSAILKQCVICGKVFLPKSNRQRFCSCCKDEAKRLRKQRWKRNRHNKG